jgi:hypothetical protein
MIRATTSVVPPAEKPTTILMGLSGYAAEAEAEKPRAPATIMDAASVLKPFLNVE